MNVIYFSFVLGLNGSSNLSSKAKFAISKPDHAKRFLPKIQSLNKILEYGNDNDLVTDDDTDKYCLRVMDILDKYLDVQPDIII